VFLLCSNSQHDLLHILVPPAWLSAITIVDRSCHRHPSRVSKQHQETARIAQLLAIAGAISTLALY
ncbi:MAG: hypothetical protein J2P37_21540, partial [Ktedonobacteraceae bacterium]|nr:hypothetical protein [Ktedonobacteraceae bacterium]